MADKNVRLKDDNDNHLYPQTKSVNVTVTDSGGYFTGTTVEAALQEIGAVLDGLESTMEAI